MTDDELQQIRARAEAAYPFERGGYFDIEYCKVGDKDTFMLAGALVNTEETAQTDREFITRARTDIDTLLAEVKRLQAENDRLLEHIWQPFSGLREGRAISVGNTPPFKMPKSWAQVK